MPESLTQPPAQEQDRDARSLFAKRKDKDKRCGWKLQNTQAGPFLDTTHPLPHSHQEVLKMLAVLLRDEGHGPSSKTLRLTPLLLSPPPPVYSHSYRPLVEAELGRPRPQGGAHAAAQ